MTSAVVAGMLFVAGLGLMVAAFVRPRDRSGSQTGISESLRELLPTIKEGEEQNLRLAGITPEAYSVQRFAGLVGGIVVGLIAALLLERGPVGTVLVIAVATVLGWFLPMLGVRSTAKKARDELDQVIRAWIVLVAQQVSAGVEPAAAMLVGARMGKRPSWRLLHRFLLAAQQERRPAWEGLVDIVERYGIHSLAPVVSALGLAAERGTRLSEAVLVAAETLWDDSTSREREAAGRRAQIVVLPATAVALALAGILIYPPFTSLTGGTGVGG
ncbi:type II secretion system F family protein [Candidatus Poriferisocius sp.]|uniref:type II secretion system F family protein n=1 Tax=Candidatus Poriferisocius sp. TaxID=3101276 RepID=UPI003B021084